MSIFISHRTKSKLKSVETMQKVNLLKAENDYLSRKVDSLSRELSLLKEIFMAHASNAHGTQITEYDLKLLTGSEMFDVPLPVASAGSVSSVLLRESALHHLTSAHRAAALVQQSQRTPSDFSFIFPGSRTFSPSSLSSRSSAHESEDDFWRDNNNTQCRNRISIICIIKIKTRVSHTNLIKLHKRIQSSKMSVTQEHTLKGKDKKKKKKKQLIKHIQNCPVVETILITKR